MTHHAAQVGTHAATLDGDLRHGATRDIERAVSGSGVSERGTSGADRDDGLG